MLVYHYCSMEAFKSIIENKTLRLTDITKSNDSAEVKLVVKNLEEILLDEYRNTTDKKLRSHYPTARIRKKIERLNTNCFDEKQGIFNFYVICFSRDGDLLSQWRGYAVDASGVSVGINQEALAKLNKFASFTFAKVDYTEEGLKSFIKNKCQELLLELTEQIESGMSDINSKNKDPFATLYLNVCRASPFFKLPFFKEEQEYRLALWDGKDEVSVSRLTNSDGYQVSKLQYETTNGILRSYTDLSFANYNGSLVKEVILGPKCNNSVNDIKRFLEHNGLNNVKVKPSAGTYR